MAVHFPHGNTKHNKDRGYVRTCPSVLRKAEKRSMTEQPSKIYKSESHNLFLLHTCLSCNLVIQNKWKTYDSSN